MRSNDRESESRRPVFARGADGRLKSAESTDLGDVWAQQKRLGLQEAIEQDKRSAKRRQRAKNLFKKKVRPDKAPEAPQTSSKTDVIEINIGLPSLRLPKIPWKKLAHAPASVFHWLRGLRKSVGMTVVVILGIMLLLLAYNLFANDDRDSSSSTGASAGSKTTDVPKFNTVLPSTKNIQELGGWGRVSPPGKDPVYAYADELSGVKITVSEQPIPSSFKPDIAESVSKLAQQFNATQKIETTDTTIYIGRSIDNVQSLIMAKDDLLILIRTNGLITNDDWIEYINSLE